MTNALLVAAIAAARHIGFTEMTASELSADCAVAGAWAEAADWAHRALAARTYDTMLLGLSRHHETEALLRAGDAGVVAEDLRRYAAKIGDNRRYRIPYLRSLAVIGNESVFGHSVREPTNRSNTYFSPGELTNLSRGGLLAASCASAGNRSQSGFGFKNVPCRVQPGFRWAGLTRYFPHVTAGSTP